MCPTTFVYPHDTTCLQLRRKLSGARGLALLNMRGRDTTNLSKRRISFSHSQNYVSLSIEIASYALFESLAFRSVVLMLLGNNNRAAGCCSLASEGLCLRAVRAD
eukprot:5507762-Amphidinium_carterae.2